MSQLINCKKCGKLFRKKLRNICDECLEKENRVINKINDFIKIYTEPFVSISVISENTDISAEEIEELFNKSRLSDFANRITIKCKICGNETKAIERKGHFCLKCINQHFNEDEIKKPNLPKIDVSIELRKFDKDIMHTNKIIPEEERLKYGFKKSFD